MMESLNSKSAGQQVSQLCTQLETCWSVEEVQRMLGELDASVVTGGHAEAVLYQLQGPTRAERLTELVLASGGWAGPLADWLLETFPTSIDQFLSSIHREVIERLSLFLTFLPYPFSRELEQQLRQFRTLVELTPKVMFELTAFSPEEPSAPSLSPTEEEVSEPCGFEIGRKKKQSEKKQAWKAKRQAGGPRLQGLQRLNIAAPRSSLEAYSTIQLMLDEMQKVLKKYLTVLRVPDIASITHGLFVIEPPSTASGETGGDKSDPADNATPSQKPAIPAAYPYVQPMKAALYFENAKGFGEWRILISSRADRGLRDARRRDRHNFEIYIKKIKELSNGHFSADNQKRLNGADSEVPVYEAKMTGDTRLVYQIDCIPEYGSDTERQVIRIFGIYTHAQIGKRLWRSMGHQLAKKGKEYHRRCTARKRIQVGDNVFHPETFPPQGQRGETNTAIIPELPKEDLEEIHSLLVLEKFVTLSKELWISIFADLDVAHVFDVTPQEMEIIEHPYSCYVLGRSGTGKTTTMLFKMLGIERAYAQELAKNSHAAKPRQLFVTQSRVLATRVEEYFSKLLESLAAAQKTNKEIKALAEKKRLLHDNTTPLYDIDDDVTWKASLPNKFSLLQDEHFPLFLTFERLARLLEGDTGTAHYGGPSGSKFGGTGNGQLVGYDLFFEKYWPHLPQDLTKNLNPSLVFSELLGVIEGSEESLSHETRHLDLISYRNLSHRAQHVFAAQRDRIYDLFKAYIRQKRQHGDTDTAERTHRILKTFGESGVLGKKVDYLYVDEAQDNLLIDAMLLRSLCRNPNGLFWAGDTAQTIAIGSSFRFNDLKAFLYRLEQRREDAPGGATQTDLRTFQLITNYRSHGGIVRCATAVIELITHFWPYAIDALAPEQGVVDGAKPVFFSGWDTRTVQYEKFLSGESGESIEFGARQCILVRDEAGRTELRQRVGDIGLILTLYESKGLEFDDVLLYKFFEDSKVELGQWRVVLNLLDSSQRQGIAAPRFDEGRHAGVCAELKFLYVAVTRSRKNLWIVDCSDKAEPMKMLWGSRGFIQTCTPGGKIPRLATSSSPEEWASTGRDLFANRRYLQAVHAFERAEMDREAMIAHAHHLREIARLIPSTTKKDILDRRKAFQLAAQSFLDRAGPSVSTEKEARVYFHNAGECYEQAGDCGDFLEDYGRSAGAYEKAAEYNSAAKLYQKSDMFDEAVAVVRKHHHEMDAGLAESVLEMARLFYFRRKDYRKARSLFDSVEKQLEYFEDNILLDECHADVLVGLGRFQEAANIHIGEGRTMDAIQVLLNDKESQESTRRANSHILQGLWQTTSFSMKIKDGDTLAIELLSLASRVRYDMLTPTQKDEVSMFRNLRTTANNGPYFRDLGFEFLKRGEKPQAMLCLDHFFLNLNFSSLAKHHSSDLWPSLENFLDYCRLFRETVISLNLADEGSQKLFNFQPASIENAYHVRVDTWLHRQYTRNAKAEILESDDDGIVVAAADLLQTLKTSLWHRLSERLSDENHHCRRLQFWTPCPPYVINGVCHRQGCSRQHLHKKEMTQGWFNDQLRGIFLQIMLYQVYRSIPTAKEPERLFAESRRYWIHKLYETLRPSAHYMGSQASLRLEDISAHAEPALDVVRSWCLDILHTRAAGKDRMMLSFLFEAATLSLMFDHSKATHYISQAPLLGIFADLHYYYRPLGSTGDRVYVVPELCQCLRAADVNFITAGILFFQQVVLRRLPIDLNLLSHLFEFLVGSVILARLRFNLHNVTLPRGWFLQLLQQINVREADTLLLDRLLNSLRQLLHDLAYGGDGGYLLFEGGNLSQLPALRELFILRVCRALGLLGYNIINDDLRQEVLDTLGILNAAKRHHSFRRFIGRHRWGGVAVAVQSSYTESQLDELLQLCSMETQAEPLKEAPDGVRREFFKSWEHALVVLARGKMRADAAEFVPKPKPGVDISLLVAADGEENDEAVDQAIEQPAADTAELVDSRNIVDTLASTAAPLALESVTEEQRALARRLLAKYRQKVRSGKLEKFKTQTQKSCDSFYLTCLELSQAMDWGERTLYRCLYLGPVPHLLTCVDAVQSYVQTAKKEIRPRMLNTSERDLEGLKRQMDDLSAVSKSTKNLRKLLEPTSALHRERNIEKLKRLVREVGDLLDRVPSSHSSGVQLNFGIATKAIVRVTEKKDRKSKPKPKLNVDDLDYMYK